VGLEALVTLFDWPNVRVSQVTSARIPPPYALLSTGVDAGQISTCVETVDRGCTQLGTEGLGRGCAVPVCDRGLPGVRMRRQGCAGEGGAFMTLSIALYGQTHPETETETGRQGRRAQVLGSRKLKR
jgi:hypothetical protein